jgi:hypothetical protein
MRADIMFGNGSMRRCTGRVVNGECVPWRDKEDIISHVKYINDKNPDLPSPLQIIRFLD